VSIYVPGSDLPSLDPTPTERSEATQSTSSWWASDLGSSEDLSPLLQFPLQFPVSTSPGPSTSSPTSLYSETPPHSLQDNNSRNVGVFPEQVPPDSSQLSPSSSPSPSLNVSSPAPSTPDNSTLLSVLSPFYSTGTDKSTSIWDPSTPPSNILPEPFHDYEHNMLTLLFGES
jgi:hypothetical protein